MTEKSTQEKLAALRREMKNAGVDAYLVPHTDAYQNEMLPADQERVHWLSDFSGSFGEVVVTKDKAALFSNPIYTEQIKEQVDPALFESDDDREKRKENDAETLNDWLLKHGTAGVKVGYDPRLFTVAGIKERTEALAAKNITLVPLEENLVDKIRENRPAPPMGKVFIYPEKYAGQSSSDKRREIADDLKKAGAKSVLLTATDAVAWLLNIRGADVPYTTVPLSYAAVHDTGDVDWFIDESKVDQDIRDFVGNHVHIHAMDDMESVLEDLAKDGTMQIDENHASVWFWTFLKNAGATLEHAEDPVLMRKIVKNDVEKDVIREAHIQDGVALVKFWKWVTEQAPKGGVTELDCVDKLLEFRKAQPDFIETSFFPIVGWAGNGAITHYHVTEESNTTITTDNLLLVDSGGQYFGGTTDNTGIFAIGTPTAGMIEDHTRVLKGHIAIASGYYNDATTGRDLDVMARQFLHKAGKDYGHGTGHPVGNCLRVHEPGAGIRSHKFYKPLPPDILLSNEPGFYKVNDAGKREYGIRIERLGFYEECGEGDLKYHFNTVSLTPIDRNLIDIDLLDHDEIRWLNAYHQEVYDKLSPRLDEEEKVWLAKATAPLARPAP